MACKTSCKLCKRLVISTSVVFNPQANRLVIGLPDGVYANCEKVCVILAQTIPAGTTITADVAFVIGDGTTQYQLLDPCCEPVLAKAIRTRTRYAMRVRTTPTTGFFHLLGKPCACCSADSNDLPAIP